MVYNSAHRHRRSIRLPGYDYAQAGAYFVTICTHQRICLFGDAVNGAMGLNDAGMMVERWWLELGNKFPHVIIDEYVIMPNHFHGIVVIAERQAGVGADLRVCPVPHPQGAHTGTPLPRVVQWFKTMTTNHYIRGVDERRWDPFHGRLWQRNYYERVIRDEQELNDTRQYIMDNPAKWLEDGENPQNW